MSKYKSLVEEISENRPTEYLREYYGQETVKKAGEMAHEYGSHAINAVKTGIQAIDNAGAAVGVPHAGAIAAGGTALAAGGLAARSFMKHRAKKVGMQQAQHEMASNRAHMHKLSDGQKRLVNKRGSALRTHAEALETEFGAIGVAALMEAVEHQYTDMNTLKETSVTELANIVRETLNEKWGKTGAAVGGAIGAGLGSAVAHASGMDATSGVQMGDVALVIGGSTLVGAALGAIIGKTSQWITKAVKHGMSREQATSTMKKAQSRLKSDPQFASKVRAASQRRKKK